VASRGGDTIIVGFLIERYGLPQFRSPYGTETHGWLRANEYAWTRAGGAARPSQRTGEEPPPPRHAVRRGVPVPASSSRGSATP
jgi:hypothetical protein